MIVFIFNPVENYNILRFNKDFLTIALITVAIVLYFVLNTFVRTNKIDINASNMKKAEPMYLVGVIILVSQFVIHTQDSCIV